MSLYTETSKSIRMIASSPSNLFEIYTLNIILSFDYYIITFLVPLYYSTQFGLTDKKAGFVFGSIGLIIGVQAILGGYILPQIGCKRGLIISTFITFVGYFVLSICKSFTLSLIAVLGFICSGTALAWPVLSLGIKRYSDETNRSTSNSIMMMGNYLAGIIAGTYVDIVWTYFLDKTMVFDVIFSTAAAASGLGFLIALTLRPGGRLEGDKVSISPAVFKSSKFWKFFTVIICVTLLHSICYEQLDATFPKFLLRVVGEKAHFGTLLSIHSANMLIGVLAFTPLTFRVSSYNLLIVGGLLGALACLMLALGSTNLNFIAFVILLSSGESILVPRTLDYTMKVAGPGEEGLYLALCNSPYYFGMILTGLISGELLQTFCPGEGEQNCFAIWKILSSGTLAVVVIMAILGFFISHKESFVSSEEPEA